MRLILQPVGNTALRHIISWHIDGRTETVFKEKNLVWDPVPELTLCRLRSQPQHIYHGQPRARIDLNPNARVDSITLPGTKNLDSGSQFEHTAVAKRNKDQIYSISWCLIQQVAVKKRLDHISVITKKMFFFFCVQYITLIILKYYYNF
jgi:hypothetical protein